MIFQLTLWPLILNEGHRPFKGLFLINGTSYDQSLCEIHIVSHIIAFQFTLQNSIFTFNEIERVNQGHWVFSGIYFMI